LVEKAPQAMRVEANGLQLRVDGLQQLRAGCWGEVGQAGVFEVLPELLDGVEVSGIGGQRLKGQPVSVHPPDQSNWLAVVHRPTVPHGHDRPREPAQQLVQEDGNTLVVEVAVEQSPAEPGAVPPFGRNQVKNTAI
jgi:hypothetical protein